MTIESIKIDLMGELHFDFEETGIAFVAQGYAKIRLPAKIQGRSVAWNREIPYREIESVGVFYRRQWEMLAPAILFLPLGIFWATISLGNVGQLCFALGILSLLGIFPLIVFLRGRPYLGIASQTSIILLPLDKHKKALRRILGLLRQQLPQSVSWNLEGTKFSKLENLDTRPPDRKPFNQKRYALICALLGLYGFANLLARIPQMRSAATLLGCAVILFALTWTIRAAWRRSSQK